MKYATDFDTLDAFYEALYSIPARLNRQTTTPQAVTKRLLSQLDNPQNNFRSVLVTGSKGKGTTALFLSALINASGKRVGIFSSPHLFDYRERIVIDGDIIAADILIKLGKRVFAAANTLTIEHPDEFPRFFEITTAIAYLYFSLRYVDIAVIETGIGALTDATNQGNPEVTALTNIEDEHGNIFGTITDIAKEKSGVIKRKTPLILGDLPETVDQLIIDHATAVSAPVTRFKRPMIPNNNGYHMVKVGEQLWITDSLAKAKNAWIALAAFAHLDLPLTDTEKTAMLQQTHLPARQETISLKPFVIIDSAHSRESAQTLANHVKKRTQQNGKTILLLSFSTKKNIMPVFSALSDADRIVLTQATNARSLPPAYIAEQLAEHTNAPIQCVDDPLQALKATQKTLNPNDVLIITGSVYLAGLISQQFRK